MKICYLPKVHLICIMKTQQLHRHVPQTCISQSRCLTYVMCSIAIHFWPQISHICNESVMGGFQCHKISSFDQVLKWIVRRSLALVIGPIQCCGQMVRHAQATVPHFHSGNKIWLLCHLFPTGHWQQRDMEALSIATFFSKSINYNQPEALVIRHAYTVMPFLLSYHGWCDQCEFQTVCMLAHILIS